MTEEVKLLDQSISKYIRPLTFPVAFKFLKEGAELPPRTKVPTRDFGYPIAFCQAMSLARKYGWAVALYQQDQACPLGQVILGYKEEPDFVKDGSLVHPLYAGSPKAGKLTQSTTPKKPVPDTDSILLAPLHLCSFEPDGVVCYGNGAQITRFVQGALYNTGGYIESRFAGRGACGGQVIVPILQDRCNVIIPGGGERVFAITDDNELAFAMPASKFKDVAEGLEATHKGGVARIPTPFAGIAAQPKFPVYYNDLATYCGLQNE